MSTLKNINNISDNFFSIIFNQTNALFPKNNIFVMEKSIALIYVFLPFLLAVFSVMIYLFLDSWNGRLIVTADATCVAWGYVFYFYKELMIGNSAEKKITFRGGSNCFFIIPNWVNHSIYIVSCLNRLFLAFIMYNLFWGQ